jgi:hypothetical protein
MRKPADARRGARRLGLRRSRQTHAQAAPSARRIVPRYRAIPPIFNRAPRRTPSERIDQASATFQQFSGQKGADPQRDERGLAAMAGR